MAELPAVVNLGPFAYKVTSDKADWRALGKGMLKNHWGYTEHTTATIYVHPGANRTLQRVTLLHEILHAAAFAGGVLDTRKRPEEAWVSMASPPFLDALTRSPGLVEFLSEAGE